MELPENTLILASLVTVAAYFLMQRGKSSRNVSSVDASEQRRRRAEAAEARVALSQSTNASTVGDNKHRLPSSKAALRRSISTESHVLKAKQENEKLAVEKQHEKDETHIRVSEKKSTKQTPTSPEAHSAQADAKISTNTLAKDETNDNHSPTTSSTSHANQMSTTSDLQSSTNTAVVKPSEKTHHCDADAITISKPLSAGDVSCSANDATSSNHLRMNDAPVNIDCNKTVTTQQNTAKNVNNTTKQNALTATETITIHIMQTSTPNAPKTPLEIHLNSTASDLRNAASEATSIPISQAKLIYRGQIIEDSTKSVKDLGLEEGSVLHLVGKPRAKSETGASKYEATSNNESRDNFQSESIESNQPEQEESSEDSIDEEEEEAPAVHRAAAIGDITTLRSAVLHDLPSLYAIDHNGWTPLHEAARGGHVHIVALLVQEAESAGVATSTFINTMSNFGNGWSPLALAIQHHGVNHPITHLIRQLGGQVIHPRRQN